MEYGELGECFIFSLFYNDFRLPRITRWLLICLRLWYDMLFPVEYSARKEGVVG